MTILGLLAVIVLLCLAIYLARLLVTDATAQKVVIAIVVVVAVLWIADGIGLLSGFSHPVRLRG